MADLNARDVEHARRMIEGTARSMGLDVDGLKPPYDESSRVAAASRTHANHEQALTPTDVERSTMTKQSKRMKRELADKHPGKTPPSVEAAVELLKDFDNTKFDQSVEIAMRLGIDPKQADQIVRGSIVLPHGIGKTLRVVVFAKGDLADEAKRGRRRRSGRRRAGREDQGRLDRLRRLHRRARHDGRRRSAGTSPRPARADAVAAGRHGHARRRQDRQGVQGRQGRVPQRRRRHRPRRGRQAQLRRRRSWSRTSRPSSTTFRP